MKSNGGAGVAVGEGRGGAAGRAQADLRTCPVPVRSSRNLISKQERLNAGSFHLYPWDGGGTGGLPLPPP